MKPITSKIVSLCLLCAVTGTTIAQDSPAQNKKDNTGTNPVNFTYDARFYNEWASLDIKGGDGSLNTQFFEFRLPLGRDISKLTGGEENNNFYNQLGQRFGFRIRARYQTLNTNSVDEEGNFQNLTASGVGDFDMRLLWLAYGSKRFLLAPGIEATFNTATNDLLGFGRTVLTPQIFFGFPNVFGKNSLFIPGYQYLFSLGGNDDRPYVSRSTIDLYFVWLFGGAGNWLITNPQIVIDHRTNAVPWQIELEWGTMIKPVPGASVYLRPGVGLGGNKAYRLNFEFGLKFVWR